MTHEEKRAKLVGLMRGYFALPVIATLGELGLSESMMNSAFGFSDFGEIEDQQSLAALFRYLESIGILVRSGVESYSLTAEGKTAFARNGAFSLLMSYSSYFDSLPEILMKADTHPTVNRARNVRGSGQLHGGKFFPSALQLFDTEPPMAIVDIGCGDGGFLHHACHKWPAVEPFGVDLSEGAIETTKSRLRAAGKHDPIAVVSDGFDVDYWSRCIPRSVRESDQTVLSLWFVAHEFSKGSPDRIVEFWQKVQLHFPRARVVVGEINRIDPKLLAVDHETSIMPEFLLFHELSRQGVLSWAEWQHILSNIPYRVVADRHFDPVQGVPASFLWLLQPVV